MKQPAIGLSPVVPDHIQADHTAFQTFLLHGVALGVPNETIDRVRQMIEHHGLECVPEPYIKRIGTLVLDLIIAAGGDKEELYRSFSDMDEERRQRILPNIAALLVMGFRSWPDQASGAGAA